MENSRPKKSQPREALARRFRLRHSLGAGGRQAGIPGPAGVSKGFWASLNRFFPTKIHRKCIILDTLVAHFGPPVPEMLSFRARKNLCFPLRKMFGKFKDKVSFTEYFAHNLMSVKRQPFLDKEMTRNGSKKYKYCAISNHLEIVPKGNSFGLWPGAFPVA